MSHHLHYHQLYDPEAHHMRYPLSHYWKSLFAFLAVVWVAVQQYVGDTGTSHYTNADWWRLAGVVVAAVGVYAKSNTPPA